MGFRTPDCPMGVGPWFHQCPVQPCWEARDWAVNLGAVAKDEPTPQCNVRAWPCGWAPTTPCIRSGKEELKPGGTLLTRVSCLASPDLFNFLTRGFQSKSESPLKFHPVEFSPKGWWYPLGRGWRLQAGIITQLPGQQLALASTA